MNDIILLKHLIEEEKAQKTYHVSPGDRGVLNEMLDEFNHVTGAGFHYLAELDMLSVKGGGEVVKKYIQQYESEDIRSYLIHYLMEDRIGDCDKIIFQLYLHFKNSNQYISPPDHPAPAAIYVRYDNAFKRLKPKRIKKDLLSLAFNPRDAFYLPLTIRMLASWKLPELKCLLISYLEGTSITPESVGLPDQAENYHPPFSFMKKELKYTAIDSLKNYPCEETMKLLKQCSGDPDKDIRSAAIKSLQRIPFS
ncbi:MAG: HEAT repeat domain-containing protein [Oscillospiraceae bacterium]|nr:HEAT repeat domain-containing protein [Oscillospiraceae bacterium]